MIVAGIGSRKGVSAEEVLSAVQAALAQHGLTRDDLCALATTGFKREETGIFSAAERLGLPVIVVETFEDGCLDREAALFCRNHAESSAASASPSHSRKGIGRHSAQTTTHTRSLISQAVAGAPSVSEAAALAAVGPGGRLLGPRGVVGRVTCAIAIAGERP